MVSVNSHPPRRGEWSMVNVKRLKILILIRRGEFIFPFLFSNFNL